MSSSVTIKSTDGAALTFKMLASAKDERTFQVSCVNGSFKAKVIVARCTHELPSTLFRDMAAQWRGWDEPKIWRDEKRNVEIKAEVESSGDVLLKVLLKDRARRSRLATEIRLENGSLDQSAFEVSSAFNHRDA